MFLVFIYIVLPIITIGIHYVSIINFYPAEIVPDIIRSIIPGVFLFYWFMNQFITASRMKLIERSVGYATLMKVHGSSTFGILLLIIVHGASHGLGSPTALSGFLAALIFAFLFIVTICFWIDTPVARLPGIRTLKAILDKRIDYTFYRRLHNLNAVAAVLVAIHVMRTTMFKDSIYTATIMMLYFLLTFGSYIHHKFIKPILLRKHTFTLEDVTIENDEIVTLQFTQNSGKPFTYTEGQFGFFTFIDGNLKGEEHPFSFSSTNSDATISITIQNEGDFTEKLRSQLETGNRLVLDGPFGHFTIEHLQKNAKKAPKGNVTFIAGGIGITPFISMMKYMQHEKQQTSKTIANVDFNWLYHRSPEDNFYRSIIDLAKSVTDKVQSFSRTLGKTFSKDTITQQEYYKERHYYICASKPTTQFVISELRSLGISKNHIHYELFSW